jgi:hypothetical protein
MFVYNYSYNHFCKAYLLDVDLGLKIFNRVLFDKFFIFQGVGDFLYLFSNSMLNIGTCDKFFISYDYFFSPFDYHLFKYNDKALNCFYFFSFFFRKLKLGFLDFFVSKFNINNYELTNGYFPLGYCFLKNLNNKSCQFKKKISKIFFLNFFKRGYDLYNKKLFFVVNLDKFFLFYYEFFFKFKVKIFKYFLNFLVLNNYIKIFIFFLRLLYLRKPVFNSLVPKLINSFNLNIYKYSLNILFYNFFYNKFFFKAVIVSFFFYKYIVVLIENFLNYLFKKIICILEKFYVCNIRCSLKDDFLVIFCYIYFLYSSVLWFMVKKRLKFYYLNVKKKKNRNTFRFRM